MMHNLIARLNLQATKMANMTLILRVLAAVFALPVGTILVCFLQAIYIGITVPKLKEATDDIRSAVTEQTIASADGSKVSEYNLDMLVIGDSLASGVGHQSHKTAIAGQVARQLLQQIHAYRVQQQQQKGSNSTIAKTSVRTTINWQSLARTGYTASRMLQKLVPRIAWEKHVQQTSDSNTPKDTEQSLSAPTERDAVNTLSSSKPSHHRLVLLSNGANEVFWLSSIASYKRNLISLLTAIQRASTDDVSIAIIGIPDLSVFPRFSYPLRWFVGWRALQMSQATEEVVQELGWPNLVYSSFKTGERYGAAFTVEEMPSDFFTIDGVHPAAAGCKLIARLAVVPALGHLKYSLKLEDVPANAGERNTRWDLELKKEP